MDEKLSLKLLLKKTKKELIVLGGFKNAKDLVKSNVYTRVNGIGFTSYLPSRKELARDLAEVA